MQRRNRQLFITSDFHLWHSNIAIYSHRPYNVVSGNSNPANIPETNRMNEDILRQFDELPDNCDIWNLGDVFFAGRSHYKEFLSHKKISEMKSIVRRMKGNGRQLFLILGNHDKLHFYGKDRIWFYYNLGFDKVYDTPVILKYKWILSHEPVYIEQGSHFINLYGHTHDCCIEEDYFTYDYNMKKKVDDEQGDSEPKPIQRWPERIISLNNYKNVCLDYNHGILEWNGDTFRKATSIWN